MVSCARVWSWVFVLVAGCNTTVEVEWENRFEGDEADELAATAVRFENRILTGGCEGGDVAYEAVFAPGETPPRPRALGRGSYGFDARAFGADCGFEAHGCTQVDFFGSLDLERVVVTLNEVERCCRAGPVEERCDCGPLPEICCDGIDQDCDDTVDNCGGSCTNGVDDDCIEGADNCEECNVASEAGFCLGDFDEDCDEAVDCADPDCAADPQCNCGGMQCDECARCDTSRTPLACVPALAEGEPCSTGVCVGGTCCPGCRGGDACAAGTTLAACGVGGECVACCTGDTCDAGVCSPDGRHQASHITAGDDFTCANVEDAVRCWGANDRWQLGSTTATGIARVPPVSAPVIVGDSLVAGGGHVCALADGDGIWCWGDNGSLQSEPRVVSPVAPTRSYSGTPFAAVTSGGAHSCALDGPSGPQHKIDCWGARDFGQLGRGDPNPVPAPGRVQVKFATPGGVEFRVLEAGPGRRLLDAGGTHTCAIRNTRDLYCWGDNRDRQITPASADGPFASPMRVTPPGFPVGFEPLDFDAGATHTCAIEPSARTLVCWGEGFTEFEAFTAPAGDQWRRVFSGERAVCALTNGSRLLCRADAAHPIVARLGVTPVDGWYVVPVLGDAAGYEEAALGTRHACAIDLVGAVVCWGDDSEGQLGGATGEGLHRICF